jgi:hypothetical protein
MIPSRGLLFLPSEDAWYHISSRSSTVIVRPLDSRGSEHRFARPAEEHLLRAMTEEGEVYSIGRIAAVLAPVSDFPAGGYPHTDREKWCEVAALLQEIAASPEERPVQAVTPRSLIPISRLRRFYETLRLINTAKVHSEIAAHLARNADTADVVDTLFADSLRHLRTYSNVAQPFHPGRNRDWVQHCRDQTDRFANCLVANLAPHDGVPAALRIESVPGLHYHVVDYEVSPLRTAGGHRFEDGRSGSSSGKGGMDLLLAASDGVPVVGEVKAPGDTSLFVALVQALTYAVEILTGQQTQRLANTYPDDLPWSGGDSVCEVLILVSEEDTPRLLRETGQIIQHLLGNPDGVVARHIRLISIVNARLAADGPPAFTLHQTWATSYHSSSDISRTGASSSAAAASGDGV